MSVFLFYSAAPDLVSFQTCSLQTYMMSPQVTSHEATFQTSRSSLWSHKGPLYNFLTYASAKDLHFYTALQPISTYTLL